MVDRNKSTYVIFFCGGGGICESEREIWGWVITEVIRWSLIKIIALFLISYLVVI